MRGGIIRYILVVSLLLNFSLLGAAAYTHYRQPAYRPVSALSSGPARSAPECSVRGNHLFHELSLEPEQVKVFQKKADEFHAGLSGKRQEVDQLRNALFQHMAADVPDNRAIEATIARINDKQEEMQKMVVAHMLEFKSMLNKDQQKKFLSMIQGAMTQHREAGCP